MRPILIMCIVIGHAFTIYTNSTYWSLPVGCQSNLLLSWINPTLISFALQTFVFISGYLFAYKSQEKIDRKSCVLSKLRRLYLPSILFSILYILILHPDRFKSLDVLYEIFSGAGHLWFLPMLFWCYVLGAFLPRIDRTKILGTSLILLLVSYMSFLIPNFLRLANSLHYFIYFFIANKFFFIFFCRFLFPQRDADDRLEQVSIHLNTKGPALQFCKALCDG